MKRQNPMPPYTRANHKTNKVVLPVTMAILGASMVVMAVMLLSKDSKAETKETNDNGVENYDVVGNKPFIFSICE